MMKPTQKTLTYQSNVVYVHVCQKAPYNQNPSLLLIHEIPNTVKVLLLSQMSF